MLKRWLPLFLVIACMIAIYVSGVLDLVSLSAIQNHADDLRAQIELHPIVSSVIFWMVYVSSVALSLPIATLLTFSAGFFFGLIWGGFMVVTAATLGAVIIFLIAKTSFGESIRQKAGPFYSKIDQKMQKNVVQMLLFMRLVPIFPFFIVNILPAMFSVSLLTFFWTTFVGILPGSFIFVNVGRSLGEVSSVSDLVSTQVLLSLAALGFLILVPSFYKWFKGKKSDDI